MKKALKGICVLSLFVLFSATANAAGMIKDYHAYRIKNQYIPKYLEVSPEFIMTNKNKVNIEFNLAPGNKGF